RSWRTHCRNRTHCTRSSGLSSGNTNFSRWHQKLRVQNRDLMSLELIGTIGLVLIFGLSMWRGINMGIIALVGAFLVGTVFLDMDSSTISANFPGSLLVTLVGVTLFFGVARTNGTVENIVSWAVKL